MTSQPKAPCKVRITGCSTPTWWYNDLIGEEFETNNVGGSYGDFVVWEDYCQGIDATWRHIAQEDCVVIERNGKPVESLKQ